MPYIHTRAVYPDDPQDVIKDKQKKPFMNGFTVILTVFLKDRQFTITALKGYCYDGATIPFGLGKGNMKLLIPALFHDIMCDKKELVNCDRNLSSLIFKELLLLCEVPKWKANVMYFAVDNFQRLVKGWN
jgi:hypothetical protein